MPRKMKVVPNGYDKAFPRNLRKLLADSKTTKKELAAYLDRSGQAISYYCDGSSSPDWETIVQIAKFFSVSTDYLLGLTTENTPNQTTQSVCEYIGLSAATVDYLHCCPDPFTRSFYRKCFDDLLQEREYRLANVPELIFDSAQAFVIAQKEDALNQGQQQSNSQRKKTSRGQYIIPADRASELLLTQAREEIRAAIELTTDTLQYEAIQALKKDTDAKSEDYRWKVISSHEP